MSVNEYLKKFSHLKTDKSRKRWLAATCHRAPHKPFLLLSIMDLIAQGQIVENFIEPPFELVDTWNGIRPGALGQQHTRAYIHFDGSTDLQT